MPSSASPASPSRSGARRSSATLASGAPHRGTRDAGAASHATGKADCPSVMEEGEMAEKREEREKGGREGRELSPWRPFEDFGHWLTPWEGLFPRRRFFEDLFHDFPTRGRGFVPAVELSENDQSYTITVEIPGVNKDDVHVDLQDGMLVIHGEK